MTTEHSQYFRTPKPRPIRPPKLHHATFMTMDVDAMVAFYELVAGLQPVYYAQHAAWLTNDEANHRIALLRLPGIHPPVEQAAQRGAAPHRRSSTSSSTVDRQLRASARCRASCRTSASTTA